MREKIAKLLLRQHDAKERRVMILKYSVGLLLLLLVHGYFSNLSSPLKLIPQTFTAVAMGYVLAHIFSVRLFKHFDEFIDWTKVTEIAESAPSPVR